MSTPDHPHYGKHFRSHHEVKSMLLPSDEAVDVVVNWLLSTGITDVEHDADWINFNTTVGVANQLLDTHFNWYVSDVKHVRRLRTLEYSVPDSIAKHIWMIQPTTRFGQIRPRHETSRLKHNSAEARRLLNAILLAAAGNSSIDCSRVNAPSCLQSLYNINYSASTRSGSKIGFSSFLAEYARYSDLFMFVKTLAPHALGQNFSVIEFNGGKNNQSSTGDSGEANLDAQYIVALSSPLPVTEFSTGGLGYLVPDINQPTGSGQNEPYLAFLQNVLKLDQEDLPQVISTSYGEDEQVRHSAILDRDPSYS
jgi:tripeptidyl-peptidase I